MASTESSVFLRPAGFYKLIRTQRIGPYLQYAYALYLAEIQCKVKT